jgi:hypothetical protein
MTRPRRRPLSAGHLLVFVPAAMLASLYLTWQVSAVGHFFYPLWYGVLDIDGHIERFGPENRYRDGFETTTADERFRLFGEIVDAVQNDGRGLEQLEYHAPDGRRLGTLFRPPEIQHLQDVAHLVATLKPWGLGALLWCVAHGLLMRRQGRAAPEPSRMLVYALGGFAAGTVILMIAGPRRVFYALHEMVFPAGHQWFFYYQDSLMSTMMKAPYLFGGIAAQLAVFTLVAFWALAAAAHRLAPGDTGFEPGSAGKALPEKRRKGP